MFITSVRMVCAMPGALTLIKGARMPFKQRKQFTQNLNL